MNNCLNCGHPLVTIEYKESDGTWGTMRVCDTCGYEEGEKAAFTKDDLWMSNYCECEHSLDMHKEEGVNEDQGYYYAGRCCAPEGCDCLGFGQIRNKEEA